MKDIIIDGATHICTPKKEVKVEHEFVDLGLPSGRLWATCNIGAEKPTDCGDYFAWGAIEPYNLDDCNTYDYKKTEAAKLSEMDDEHDAAKILWGDGWRMPTLTDFAELIDNCTCDSEVIGGIGCDVFTSKANNQKIVMPYAGYVDGGSLDGRGRGGSCWSRSFGSSTYAWVLHFGPIVRLVVEYYRKGGCSVRPVRA